MPREMIFKGTTKFLLVWTCSKGDLRIWVLFCDRSDTGLYGPEFLWRRVNASVIMVTVDAGTLYPLCGGEVETRKMRGIDVRYGKLSSPRGSFAGRSVGKAFNSAHRRSLEGRENDHCCLIADHGSRRDPSHVSVSSSWLSTRSPRVDDLKTPSCKNRRNV